MTSRTTLITGAASGIGAALAAHLQARGGTVIGVDLHGADIACDLGQPAQRAALADRLLAAGQPLDAVVACAGVTPPVDGGTIVAVNYFGVTDLLPRLLPLLQSAAQPRAVAISSIAAIQAGVSSIDALQAVAPELVALCLAGDEAGARHRGEALGIGAYASSKRALTQWIRRTAVLPGWSGRGVLLNGIAPGVIKTRLALPTLATSEGRAMLAQAVPLAMADYAEPADIAPLLAFLAGEENRYLVGQVPFADGGSEVLLRGEEQL